MFEKIQVQVGDITKIGVDAIVNAANKGLSGGGGVDGAIHRVGGQTIMDELSVIRKKITHLPTGEAVITTAGNLPAKYVIHTVGPIYDASQNDEMARMLANCYQNSLQLAVENQCKTISFPAISTGVYRYPAHLAAQIAVKTVSNFLSNNNEIEQVIFVCFDYSSFRYYQNFLKG